VIDLFDIAVFGSGVSTFMDPWLIVMTRFGFALPASFALAYALSKFEPLAWTIGLGPTPWDVVRTKRAEA